MEATHLIEEIELNFTFDSEDVALLEQGDLGDFVKNRVVAAVDAAFTEESIAGAVLRLDRLEIDVGRISYQGYRNELVQRVGDMTREAIRERAHYLMADGGGEGARDFAGSAGSPLQREGKLLARECSELELLLSFLVHGHFPWHQAYQGQDLDVLLQRVLQTRGEELIVLLKGAAERDLIAARLVRQFREHSLSAIIALVVPGGHLAARALVEKVCSEVGRLALQHDSWNSVTAAALCPLLQTWSDTELPRGRGVPTLRDLTESLPTTRLWELLLRLLLRDVPASRLEECLLKELVKVRVDTEEECQTLLVETRDSLNMPVAQPRRGPSWFAKLLQKGDLPLARTVWQRLLQEAPSVLESEIRAHGQQAAVIRTLASSLPDAMLLDVVRLLEPLDCVLIQEVVTRPELFREAAELRQENPGAVRRRVWEFTLSFLLVERSSEFNRKSYLGSLLRQMAAHYNLDHRNLLRSLRGVLLGAAVQGALKREMLELLALLEEQSCFSHGGAAVPRSRSYTGGDSSDPSGAGLGGMTGMANSSSLLEGEPMAHRAELSLRARLEQAFLSGDAGGIRELWPHLVKHKRSLVVGVLRGAMDQALAARKMVEGFPVMMLSDLVILLEPVQQIFILKVVEDAGPVARAATVPQGCDDLKRRLWEFTLVYLMTERGSHFNKKSYVGSVLSKTSACYGLDYGELLASLRHSLNNGDATSQLRREMLSVLDELEQECISRSGRGSCRYALANRNPSALSDLQGRVAASLLQAGAPLLSPVWKELLSRPASDLKKILREMKARALLRGAVTALSEEMLRESVTLLASADAPFVCEVAVRAELLVVNRFPITIEEMQRTREQVWEFTLHFLAVDRGSAFNRRSYLESLLHEMAIRQNVSYRQLVLAFFGRLQGLDLPGPFRSVLRELFLDGALLEPDPVSEEHRVEPIAAPTGPYLIGAEVGSASAAASKPLGTRQSLCADVAPSSLVSAPQPPSAPAGRGPSADLPGSGPSHEDKKPPSSAAQPAPRAALDAVPTAGRGLSAPLDHHPPFFLAGSPQNAMGGSLRSRTKPLQPGLQIYITNAGQVLAAPYLPRLFTLMKLTGEKGFISPSAAERAVHLLQFMVNPTGGSPEHLLVLNKILCGIEVNEPVVRDLAITEREKEGVEGLIKGMIRNWEVVGNATIAGFRESFLQREGRLRLRNEHWHLLVETRAYDLLLDRLPWSFSVIKFPWMTLPVHVEWREGL